MKPQILTTLLTSLILIQEMEGFTHWKIPHWENVRRGNPREIVPVKITIQKDQFSMVRSYANNIHKPIPRFTTTSTPIDMIYDDNFGLRDDELNKIDLIDKMREKKQVPVENPPPLERDEIAAAPEQLAPGEEHGLGYPEEVIPNLTCLTENDLLRGKNEIAPHYSKPKCPRSLPCRKYASCLLWKTGLLDKKFQLNMDVAKAYYGELFQSLHPAKLKEIMLNWEDCVNSYKLNEPFDKGGDTTTHEPDTSHTHKPKVSPLSIRKRDDNPHEAEIVLSGLTDCYTRVEDFTECNEIAELKGVCYWPDEVRA